jgi:hypothetical protein
MDRVNHEKEHPTKNNMMTASKAELPSQAALATNLKDIVNPGCATELYVDFNKIGEGYGVLI